jgi:hypothetical protein
MATPLGSGAGAFGAGVGPAGHDPEDALVGATRQTPVAALYFDPFNRVYAQNADYTMVTGAGPIHRAAHLLLPLGSLPATPNSGIDIAAIKRAPPQSRIAVIEDALRRTWKPLLETGQITMGKVTLLDHAGKEWTVDSGFPWPGKFDVAVQDLVTNQSALLEAKVS